jgi:hypothetical protein
VDTVEGLRDAAQRARECAVMGDAVTLTRWIGTGRRLVTAGPTLEGWPPDDGDLLAALGREVA